jgi:photosystem II stability/assembly factor-like uncharacterized protein
MKDCLCVLFLLIGSLAHGQWQKTNGPFGGGAGYGITSHGTSLYAATFYGVYSSSDTIWKSPNGKSWEFCGTFGYPIQSLIAHGEGIYISYDPGSDSLGAIFRTLNSGTSWQQMTTAFEFNDIKDIVSIKSSSRLLAASLTEGIYFSNTHGVSWGRSFKVNGDTTVSQLFCDGDMVYAAGENLFIYSTDFGETWIRPKNEGISNSSYFKVDDIGGVDTALIVSLSVSNSLVISNDNGEHWRPYTSPSLPERTIAYTMTTLSDNIYLQTEDGLYMSNDGGASWVRRDEGIDQFKAVSMVSFFGYMIAFDNIGNVRGSNNGGDTWVVPQWMKLAAGEKITSAIIHDDKLYTFGTNFSVYEDTTDRTFTALSSECSSPIFWGNKIYAVEGANMVMFSSPSGYSSRTSYPLPEKLMNYKLAATTLYLHVTGEMIFSPHIVHAIWNSTSGAWYSRDSVNNGLELTTFHELYSNFFIGTRYHGLLKYNHPFSPRWLPVSQLGLNTSVITIYTSGFTLYVSVSNSNDINDVNGLYSSNDNGSNWWFVGEGLPECASLCTHTDGYLYAGTIMGVYKRKLDELQDTRPSKSIHTLSYYPNPAHDHIVINEDAKVTLFTITGAEAFKATTLARERMILPKLVPGVYIAKIETKNGITNAKVVIQ